MRCPKCSSSNTKVVDSRLGKNEYSVRRRRACGECDYRFTTSEEILREDMVVVKRDGRREDFDRNKLFNGLRKACEKRPVDPEQIDLLISDVLLALERDFNGDVPSRAVGEYVMRHLRKIDKIAYVRFASVYKDFRDIDELAQEIHDLHREDIN